MVPKLPIKKLVVELRYKLDLGFYGKMDAFGLELAEDYADWERSALTLEVRNKKKHRRLFLSAGRAILEMDDLDPDVDFRHAEELLGKVCHTLGVNKFSRVGIRQWFAADLGKPFALMVDQFAERFLPKNQELSGIFTDKTKDVAYVVECEVSEGWRYNLRLGPMTKKQWFLDVAHELNAFEQGDDATETFEKFRQTIPEHFLFIDIDCFREDQPADSLNKLFTSVRRRSHDLASTLIQYCKR